MQEDAAGHVLLCVVYMSYWVSDLRGVLCCHTSLVWCLRPPQQSPEHKKIVLPHLLDLRPGQVNRQARLGLLLLGRRQDRGLVDPPHNHHEPKHNQPHPLPLLLHRNHRHQLFKFHGRPGHPHAHQLLPRLNQRHHGQPRNPHLVPSPRQRRIVQEAL